jgi:hypothetical protein
MHLLTALLLFSDVSSDSEISREPKFLTRKRLAGLCIAPGGKLALFHLSSTLLAAALEHGVVTSDRVELVIDLRKSVPATLSWVWVQRKRRKRGNH